MQSDQCLTCKWKILGKLACAAYPRGIPTAIVTGRHDHREPYRGDGGYRWELDPAYEGVVDPEEDR